MNVFFGVNDLDLMRECVIFRGWGRDLYNFRYFLLFMLCGLKGMIKMFS